MKHFINCLLLTLSLMVPAVIEAQDVPPSLLKISENIVRRVNEELPGWRHKPLEGEHRGKEVIVDTWYKDDSGVQVSILQHGTRTEAKNSLKDYKASKVREEEYAKERRLYEHSFFVEETTAIGDGGFVWKGVSHTSVVFSKGVHTAYINASGSDASDALKFAKEFAGRVAAALPSADNEPQP